ncbi:fasciclin-2 isoform X1 [Manduca sexta]|uniref:fasciclin-2 isoform X1 n=2 Tax=Manduca sexta TaxID=7130 RepID=UPI0018902F84|nr:fasciclin-2 isoform X1 [Manduca sexta]
MATLILSVVCVLFIRGCSACFNYDDNKSMSIATGNTYYQECICNETGYGIQNLEWRDKDDNVISAGPGTDSNIYLEYQGDRVNLHIENISKTMSGTYKCITKFEGQQYAQNFDIEAYEPLIFHNALKTQYLLEGSDSRIDCIARGDSEPIINWEKGVDKPIEIKSGEKYQLTPQGLIVKNVTVKDGGTYKCAASVIQTGEQADRFINVQVLTVPVIKNINAMPEATVGEGESLTLECIVEPMPEPEYIWRKIENNNENSSQTLNETTNIIVFNNVSINDSGIYECIVQNKAGNATRKIEVTVLQMPKIIDFKNRTEVEGTNITIICNATGYPEPNITISAIKRDDYEDGEYVVIIPPDWQVEHTYQGSIVCEATNEMGSDVKEMYLEVLHKPYFNKLVKFEWGWTGKTVNLSCAHKSNPPAEIVWRYHGNDIRTEEQVEINKNLLEMLSSAKDHYLPIIIDKNFSYGIYECEAKNEIGAVTKTVTLKQGFVPPEITNASIIDLTATSVLFSIEEPKGLTGPDIVGFTAEYDKAENYNITNIHNNRTWGLERPFKLEKLKPNTKYQIKFAAQNAVGTGPWGETLEFITLKKSAPEPPVWDLDFVETSSACDQVIKWKIPEDNGEPIDMYTLRYCTVHNITYERICVEENVEKTTHLELRDLECNTTYSVELVAHNAIGNSTVASISFVTPVNTTEESESILPAGVIIGIAVVVVILCIVLLDLILYFWKKQGILATCCCKNNKKTKNTTLNSRDKKGLLRDNCESTDDSLKRPNKGHKEYEYNKTTGIITGKHSAV